jgi:hypothetical protein
MSAFFAFDAIASSKPSKEKIAVQNLGTLFHTRSLPKKVIQNLSESPFYFFTVHFRTIFVQI